MSVMDENNNMSAAPQKSRAWIWIVVLLLVLAAGAFAMRGNDAEDNTRDNMPGGASTGTPVATSTGTPSPATSTPNPTSTSGTPAPSTVTVNVVGSAFAFNPTSIRVKQGQRVRIVFRNAGGMHDWVIDEFNARTPVIQAGQTATVEFVASRKGTFEYYCSVMNHRAQGMKGSLIVE